MIEFFQKLESFEEELLIRNEAVHSIYVFTNKKYELLANTKFHEAEDYDVNIISGLVGTFQSFGDLRNIDAINSIQFNYLRILFTISDNYITVFAVDPEHTDEYYFKVIRLFLDCFALAINQSSQSDSELSREIVYISLNMIFSILLENHQINIIYEDEDEKKVITAKTIIELNNILRDIYGSHEKFFKQVIS